MLPTAVSEDLAGLWMIEGAPGETGCSALEVVPDPDAGPGLFAKLLYWKQGRTGCDSCSSDVGEIELDGQLGARGELGLQGTLPRRPVIGPPIPVRLAIALNPNDLTSGLLRGRFGNQSVVLRAAEFLPPFDPV